MSDSPETVGASFDVSETDEGVDTQSTEEQEQDSTEVEQPKHRVKVDGEEAEVTLDELIRDYQLKKVSDKRLQEAARIRKEHEQDAQLMHRLKSDPSQVWQLLEQLGANPSEIAMAKATEHLEWELKPEEERKLIELQRERDKLKDELDSRTQKEKDAEHNQLMQRVSSEIDQEITSVLKETGIKPTPKVIARIAEQMIASLERGDERIAAKDAYDLTIEDLRKEVADFIVNAPIEQSFELLGKDFEKSARQYLISKVTEGKPFQNRPTKRPSPEDKQKPKLDLFEELEQRFSN